MGPVTTPSNSPFLLMHRIFVILLFSMGVAAPLFAQTIKSDVQREIVRRQEDLITANKLVEQGDQAMKEKNYEVAYSRYLTALDLIGSGDLNKPLRNQVLAKFSEAGVAYAQKLINDGRYSDAEKVAKTILLPQYNPTYQPAVQLLSNLEQPDYYNKTVTPQFAADRDEVKRLLAEAEGFSSSGRIDLAMKRYEQVLNIDPYNIAARKGQEQLNSSKQTYYNNAYNETRSNMLWQVQQAWVRPVRKFSGHGDEPRGVEKYNSGTAKITAKLNRLIIPKIDLHDVTLRQAVDFLHNQSKILDTAEEDPQKRGVNIVLMLAQPGTGTVPATGADAASPAPAQQGAPVVDNGANAATASAAALPSEDTVIDLSLNNVPLYDALKYLARYADMKIKIDTYAVEIVPQTEPTESLTDRTFKVPAGFIPTQTAASGALPPAPVPGASSGTDSSTPRIAGRANAKEYLESQNISFPQGASATYNPSNSTLTVRNTPSTMDIIEVLVDEAWRGAPQQIQIESKFLEITQDNLKELGFDWLLGPISIGNASGAYGAGGTLGEGQTISSKDYPIVSPGGGPIGQNPLTGGLRTGDQAITPTSIEGVIAQQSNLLNGATSGPGPGIFSLAGVFTNPQFQLVIRALNQKKGVDLMTAPMVTTKSGQKAKIDIVREFRYPTQFTPPQIPQSTGGGSGSGGGTTILPPFISTATITPTTPSQFEIRNIGVTLDVEPIVASDGYTIDLNLSPQVVDFEGFINYGTPILGITVKGVGVLKVPQTVQLSPNVINQPIFSTRKVVTSVSIYDGQTVALGGLIREDVQKVQDKVPILGDIPLAGRLFRSDADKKTKQNLIIFVTAHLVDAQGNFLRNTEEEEDTVTPLGVPENLPKPQMPAIIQGK